jgi:hypothetical protein
MLGTGTFQYNTRYFFSLPTVFLFKNLKMSDFNLSLCRLQVRAEYRAEQVHVYCGEGDCHAPLYQDWGNSCSQAGMCGCCCWRAVASCCCRSVNALLLMPSCRQFCGSASSFLFDVDRLFTLIWIRIRILLLISYAILRSHAHRPPRLHFDPPPRPSMHQL